MSIQNLRARLHDIPETSNLAMSLEAGRIVLRWGVGPDYVASADASASDADIEAAVRNAVKLPSISLIPDKPDAPAPAPATQTKGQPMSVNPADAMAALDRSMSSHVRRMQDLIDGQVRAIESKQSRQLQTVEKHLGAFGDQLDAQPDAFDAIMSRYSNGAPA